MFLVFQKKLIYNFIIRQGLNLYYLLFRFKRDGLFTKGSPCTLNRARLRVL